MSDEKPVIEPAAQEINPVPEVVEDKIDLSKHVAELKRRDRELQAERVKFKQEMESEKTKWLDEFKKSPIKKAQELGVNADDLSSQLLGLEAPATPEDELRRELAELKAWKEAQEASKSQAENDRLLSEYRNEVFTTLEKDGDRFELVLKSPGGREAYWNTVIEYYKKYGQAPDLQELADGLESELFERNKQLLGLKKFAPAPAPAPISPEPKVESKPASESFKTLSSRMSAQTAPKIKVVDMGAKIPMQSAYASAMDSLNERIKQKLK